MSNSQSSYIHVHRFESFSQLDESATLQCAVGYLFGNIIVITDGTKNEVHADLTVGQTRHIRTQVELEAIPCPVQRDATNHEHRQDDVGEGGGEVHDLVMGFRKHKEDIRVDNLYAGYARWKLKFITSGKMTLINRLVLLGSTSQAPTFLEPYFSNFR